MTHDVNLRSDNDNRPPAIVANSGAANDNNLRFFSVCSGIEAASVAWSPLGWRAVGFAEIDRAASLVLAHHYPGVPNYGDFTKIDTHSLGRVDILCGGTPCQAFSVAGKRESLADARGNLTLAFVDLAHALAKDNGLRNVVWENVPGVLNTDDNAFGCFLAGLVGADDALCSPDGSRWPDEGMVEGPRARAAWRILDAQYFGLAQRRRRVILVADFGKGSDPAAVLFERASLRGDTPARREEGQGVAGTISARTSGGGGLGTDFDLAGGVVEAVAYGGNRTSGPIDVATAVNAHGGAHGRQDFESETFLVHAIQAGAMRENPNSGPDGVGIQADVAYTLEARAEVQAIAFDPRATDVPVTGDITGVQAASFPSPAICFTAKDYGGDAAVDIAPTLRAGTHNASHQNGGVTPAVTVALRGREGGGTAELGGSVATALRASSGGGDKPHVLASGAIATSAVRRLTPIECERLQGFPEVRKILYIEAWKHNSSDLQKTYASAAIPSRKSRKSASTADESELQPFVNLVAENSITNRLVHGKPVVVSARINLERSVLHLHSAEKSNWSVSIAEHLNPYLLHMPIADFVRLVAHTFTIQDQITRSGKAASPANTNRSLLHWSGSRLAVPYGRESVGLASDAGSFIAATDDFMKFTTSEVGPNIQSLEQRLQISLSFVTSVISSCIPEEILAANLFDLSIEGVCGYTYIPTGRGKWAADGPRYKQLGNSWAVPKFRWLGKRIARLMPVSAQAANDNTSAKAAA